jgi:hypothetical protein
MRTAMLARIEETLVRLDANTARSSPRPWRDEPTTSPGSAADCPASSMGSVRERGAIAPRACRLFFAVRPFWGRGPWDNVMVHEVRA